MPRMSLVVLFVILLGAPGAAFAQLLPPPDDLRGLIGSAAAPGVVEHLEQSQVLLSAIADKMGAAGLEWLDGSLSPGGSPGRHRLSLKATAPTLPGFLAFLTTLAVGKTFRPEAGAHPLP
jgi:hypothetical protein